MIDTFVKLKNESLKYGLTVNVHKRKYLKCSRTQDPLKAINIENKEIEQVRSFKYLGVNSKYRQYNRRGHKGKKCCRK